MKRYKEAKEWNSWQTGGSKKKSMFYDEIDAVLGCRDIVNQCIHSLARKCFVFPDVTGEEGSFSRVLRLMLLSIKDVLELQLSVVRP